MEDAELIAEATKLVKGEIVTSDMRGTRDEYYRAIKTIASTIHKSQPHLSREQSVARAMTEDDHGKWLATAMRHASLAGSRGVPSAVKEIPTLKAANPEQARAALLLLADDLRKSVAGKGLSPQQCYVRVAKIYPELFDQSKFADSIAVT